MLRAPCSQRGHPRDATLALDHRPVREEKDALIEDADLREHERAKVYDPAEAAHAAAVPNGLPPTVEHRLAHRIHELRLPILDDLQRGDNARHGVYSR